MLYLKAEEEEGRSKAYLIKVLARRGEEREIRGERKGMGETK